MLYVLTDINKPRAYWYRLKQTASEHEKINNSELVSNKMILLFFLFNK